MWSFFGSLGAYPAFLCGFVAGIIGLIAVIKQHERSLLVYLAMIPLLFEVIFILGEFLIPH
jgi:Ca2+/Na+ antiporter